MARRTDHPWPTRKSVTPDLVAAVVTFGDLGDGVEHVGWSEDGADGPHFIVMRNFSDGAGYCMVANDATYYGGVKKVNVSEGATHFLLTPEAAEALGMGIQITIQYPPTATSAKEIKDMLDRLLAS